MKADLPLAGLSGGTLAQGSAVQPAATTSPQERIQPLLELRGVAVRFGAVTALQDVDLHIGPDECVALVGANGCGKTTLLRVLHGLLRPSLGEVQVPPPRAQAMLFQRPYMMRTTVARNIALGLWLRGTPWAEARARAGAALERVQMAQLAERNARGLSGGQQQRLALARAWALAPAVLLLDEPTASLDPHAKHEVESLMAELSGAPAADSTPPMTMVFASHNLGQVKRLARRVIYLEQGRVCADLPTDAFFDRATLRAVSPEADLFLKGELL
ncbi:MAG: ATP-binding cassette domain-containing protein [Ottowia sp.]|nr:ATP-binding cassette domain-containing protein [Ottowia sp.]